MPEIAEFFEKGEAFITASKAAAKGRDGEKSDHCVAFNPWTNREGWLIWGQYFLDTYGDVPKAFRMVENRELDSFTFPAPLPEWVDMRYASPHPIRYVPKLKQDHSQPRTAREIEMADRAVAVFKELVE